MEAPISWNTYTRRKLLKTALEGVAVSSVLGYIGKQVLDVLNQSSMVPLDHNVSTHDLERSLPKGCYYIPAHPDHSWEFIRELTTIFSHPVIQSWLIEIANHTKKPFVISSWHDAYRESRGIRNPFIHLWAKAVNSSDIWDGIPWVKERFWNDIPGIIFRELPHDVLLIGINEVIERLLAARLLQKNSGRNVADMVLWSSYIQISTYLIDKFFTHQIHQDNRNNRDITSNLSHFQEAYTQWRLSMKKQFGHFIQHLKKNVVYSMRDYAVLSKANGNVSHLDEDTKVLVQNTLRDQIAFYLGRDPAALNVSFREVPFAFSEDGVNYSTSYLVPEFQE